MEGGEKDNYKITADTGYNFYNWLIQWINYSMQNHLKKQQSALRTDDKIEYILVYLLICQTMAVPLKMN